MTLKEKFKTINCKDCDIPYCDTKCTILAPSELIKLEQIADDYAIGFGEWLIIAYNGKRMLETYNILELLEIYKKEKKL